MSIKLRFEHQSIQMQAVLNDDALVELLTFITKHKSDDILPPLPITPALNPFEEASPANLASASDRSVVVKAWMKKHSAAEILNKIKWDTYPEKILLMGAFHESKVETDNWRSADIENRFIEAKDARPSNFPRDIANGIKSGFVTTITARTYIVSRTGWNKIADVLGKMTPEEFNQ